MNKLSPGQTAALRRIGAKAVVEVFAPGPSERSLVKRGLARRQFIGMRWWRFALTAPGRALLKELTDETV